MMYLAYIGIGLIALGGISFGPLLLALSGHALYWWFFQKKLGRPFVTAEDPNVYWVAGFCTLCMIGFAGALGWIINSHILHL